VKGGDTQVNSSIFFKNIQIYRARKEFFYSDRFKKIYFSLHAGRKKFFHPHMGSIHKKSRTIPTIMAGAGQA
jgi:hypothetical protein